MRLKNILAFRLRLRQEADHAVAVSYSRAAPRKLNRRRTAMALDRAVSSRTRTVSCSDPARASILQRNALSNYQATGGVGSWRNHGARQDYPLSVRHLDG